MAKQSRNRRPIRRTTRSGRAGSGGASRRRPAPYEFKPDSLGASWIKRLYLTRNQRMNLLKWFLYVLLCVAALVIQDVILSRFRFLGATTDLVPAVIVLICMIEGTDRGSLFVLLASLVYCFSGSAPGAYSIALLSIYTIFALLFRQTYWHQSFGSVIVCTGVTVMLYEMSVFLAGIFLGLTQWGRFYRFALAGLMSWLVMFPLHPLCVRIGRIGGNSWSD